MGIGSGPEDPKGRGEGVRRPGPCRASVPVSRAGAYWGPGTDPAGERRDEPKGMEEPGRLRHLREAVGAAAGGRQAVRSTPPVGSLGWARGETPWPDAPAFPYRTPALPMQPRAFAR